MSRSYEMYSDDGDDAVHEALMKIASMSKNHVDIWNRSTLVEATKKFIEEVAVRHSEVYDTEPRGHIADFLDQLCEEYGWTYDQYTRYELS